ncbi:MAG: response regulator [Leptolyngbyaceae cyanobacterium MO_188.B28]|nr:response regulator [Leptolyngbyaceae cyanobacterium MO_188.B28]
MSNKHILAISETADVLKVIKLSLQLTAGWEVLTVNSAKEGLVLADVSRPNAILLDADMPEIGAPSFLQTLQANPATHHIPVIVMAESDRSGVKRQFCQLGATAVIPQLFEPTHLAKHIAEALGWPWPS